MFDQEDKNYIFMFLFSKPTSLEASSPTSTLAPPEHPPLARQSSRSYDLQERRRTGNMTGAEQAKYQRIPTDETEAQTLASADLDGIKSEYSIDFEEFRLPCRVD